MPVIRGSSITGMSVSPGMKFGELTAMDRMPNKPGQNRTFFLFKCACGNEVIVDVFDLRKKVNPKRSCGGTLGKHKNLVIDQKFKTNEQYVF